MQNVKFLITVILSISGGVLSQDLLDDAAGPGPDMGSMPAAVDAAAAEAEADAAGGDELGVVAEPEESDGIPDPAVDIAGDGLPAKVAPDLTAPPVPTDAPGDDGKPAPIGKVPAAELPEMPSPEIVPPDVAQLPDEQVAPPQTSTPCAFDAEMDHTLKMVYALLTRGMAMTLSKDPEAQKFFMTRKSCQFDCMGKMTHMTLKTLYGKIGGEAFKAIPKNDDLQGLFYETMIGTFRACFPAPPRETLAKLVGELMGNMMVAMDTMEAPPPLPLPDPIVCENELMKDTFPVTQFQEVFGTALKESIAKEPRLAEYIQTQTKSCQQTCLNFAITGSAFTLFLYNNKDQQNIKDALSGAFHACLPGVPHEVCEATIGATVEALNAGQKEAEDIAEYRIGAKFFKSRKGLQMIGVATAGVLMVFMAGCLVGRRVQRMRESKGDFAPVSAETPREESRCDSRAVLIPDNNIE